MSLLTEEVPKLGGGNDSLASVLEVIKKSKDVVDNIVLLSDLMISDGYNDYKENGGSTVEYLKDYV